MPSALGGICTLKFLALYISAMASSTKNSSLNSFPRFVTVSAFKAIALS